MREIARHRSLRGQWEREGEREREVLMLDREIGRYIDSDRGMGEREVLMLDREIGRYIDMTEGWERERGTDVGQRDLSHR